MRKHPQAKYLKLEMPFLDFVDRGFIVGQGKEERIYFFTDRGNEFVFN
ncbi:hypothetical protein JYG23_01100 [Sedimentibacter sp. zth1]|nr:hypothetical protein [Sedimentibacter sp. zth1]QSX06093.1 hypothetical protein JYG23_01100 [Sedimentibacter sp. zth1]